MPNEYEIEIVETNVIDGGIEVFARAWNPDGTQIGFGDGTVDIERFRIYNPPILVPDPAGPIGITIPPTPSGSRGKTTVYYRVDPKEAVLQNIAHTISVMKSKHDASQIIAEKTGNTTSTFYPDAHTESTTVDGRLDRGGTNEAWSSLRGGNGTLAVDNGATGDICWIYMTTSSNQYGTLERSIFAFNTAAISTDSISSATLSIYGNAKDDPTSTGIAINITEGVSAANTSLSASDFQSNAAYTTAFSSNISYASFNTAGYNDFAFNASGIAAINKTGISKFAAKNNFDITNTAPTWSSNRWLGFSGYFADQAGTTNDPKLVVEHSAAAATFTPRISFIM